MKKCFLLLICVLLLCCSSAFAANTVPSGFKFYVDKETTVLPGYPDLSGKIGEGLTKDDFYITYDKSQGENDFTIDADGRVTVNKRVSGSYLKYIFITYTPKVSGVGTTTVFRAEMKIAGTPLTEIDVKKSEIVVALTETAVIEVWQETGTEPAIDITGFDSNLIDAKLEKTSTYYIWNLKVTGKRLGETSIQFVAYNGVTVTIPVKVTNPPSKFSFGAPYYNCYLGDTLDWEVDLGTGDTGICPTIYLKHNTNASYIYEDYFQDGWKLFTPKATGIYHFTMSMRYGYTASVQVNVYDRANCADIKLSKEKPHVGDQYLYIYTYDEEGNRITAPMMITKGQDIASIDYYSNTLKVKGKGLVEITVTNPDGSQTVRTFEIYETPTKIILNATNLTMEIGETFDLEVSFNKGDASYRVSSISTTGNPPYGLEPIRLEGQKIIAQAPGTAVVKVELTDMYMSAECKISVNYSDKSVWISKPSGPFGIGDTFQLEVYDDAGNKYPATFKGDSSSSEYFFSLTSDGLLTGKGVGKAKIIATLEDGRILSYIQEVYRIPRYMHHDAMIHSITEKSVSLGSIYTDVGTIVSDTKNISVTVADETVAKWNGAYFYLNNPGTTAVTITEKISGVQASFTLTVLPQNDKLYAGSTTMQVPSGFSAYLPAVYGADGQPMTVNWEITWQMSGVGNPEATGFYLENNESIVCTWPRAQCEVTGVAKDGTWVRVSVFGYQMAESINLKRDKIGFHVNSDVAVSGLIDPVERGSKFGPILMIANDAEMVTFEVPDNLSTGKVSVKTSDKAGTTLAGVFLANGAYDLCEVKVVEKAQLKLPSKLEEIGEEAFMGTAFTYADLCGIDTIGPRAFKDCESLVQVWFDISNKDIADNAFDGSSYLVILAYNVSQIVEYAVRNGIPYI